MAHLLQQRLIDINPGNADSSPDFTGFTSITVGDEELWLFDHSGVNRIMIKSICKWYSNSPGTVEMES